MSELSIWRCPECGEESMGPLECSDLGRHALVVEMEEVPVVEASRAKLLEEALQFYADEGVKGKRVWTDIGKVARNALEAYRH